MKKLINLLFSTFTLILFLFLLPSSVSAATKYWVGGNGDSATTNANDWSTTNPSACNDGGGNASAVPGSGDVAIFDPDCDNNSAISSNWSVQKIDLQSGYIGTVTQNSTVTVTIDPGTSGDALVIAGGTFTGGDSAIDINDGNFNQTGGTFTNSSGNMTVEQNFTVSGGTFTNTGTTVTFDGTTFADDSTLTCSGTIGGTISVAKVDGDFILSSGCSISFGTSPTTSQTTSFSHNPVFTNNGTISISSGTWTHTGDSTDGSTITNNGTITHSGTGWDINDGSLVNNSGGTITYAGTAITVERSFTQSGTFDLTGITVTFDNSNGGDDSTVTCAGTLGGTVVITKNSDGDFIVASGCSISLGASPTTIIDTDATNPFDNNGTVTIASCAWTVTGDGGNINNDGTITHSGTGWDINDTSFTNSSGATTTYTGTAITMERSFTQNGTFDLTGITITFDGTGSGDNSTITCTGTLGGTVAITKSSNSTNSGSDIVVATGCSISIGASPTTTFDGNNFDTSELTNNGTITIASGTWTVNTTSAQSYFIINNGTITHNGASPGWDINDTSFTNSSGATTTYTGTAITMERSFTQNGTFDLTGITITFDGTGSGDNSTITCNQTIQGNITVNKTHATGNTTLGGNCTIAGTFTRTDGPVANPASAYTLTVQGDFSMSTTDTFGGANMTFAMGGGSTQTITQNAGSIAGPFTVNKSAGTASIASGLNLSTGSTCTVVEGTFGINGRTFTCGSTFTVEDGGTLQRFGTSGESLTTPTLNSGSTVTYTGDGDSAADTITITTMIATYHHLTINSTDGTTDTFQLGADLDINGLMTLTAGTLDVSSSNYGITVGGGWTDTGAGTYTERTGTVNVPAPVSV